MIMSTNQSIRALLAAAAFVFAGCLLDQKPTQGIPEDATKPARCGDSPLCRVETPADTISLTDEQKEELVKLIDVASDSAVVTIATVDLESLRDTNMDPEVVKEFQRSLLEDLKVPVDLSSLPDLAVDSLLASVRMNASPDGTINLQWSGTVAGVAVQQVSLNVKDDHFLGGYAVVDGKTFSFQPLGGDKIAIVYDSKLVWIGECPPLPKTTASQLTCSA